MTCNDARKPRRGHVASRGSLGVHLSDTIPTLDRLALSHEGADKSYRDAIKSAAASRARLQMQLVQSVDLTMNQARVAIVEISLCILHYINVDRQIMNAN